MSSISARNPGYEPLSWSNFRHSGARSRHQTKTQTGSDERLLGYQVQQKSSPHLQRIGAALQVQVRDDAYVKAQWNAARTPDIWTFVADPAAFDHGGGLILGADTFIGPMRMAIMTSAAAGPYVARIALGPSF
ncbi:MAG: hypothetical protein PPP56_02545 [Longimonas sp.]|uniref:hypothetical protein n=1 Tax=Longimonas sp. TaxID=2039626 RepID=UPI003350BA20